MCFPSFPAGIKRPSPDLKMMNFPLKLISSSPSRTHPICPLVHQSGSTKSFENSTKRSCFPPCLQILERMLATDVFHGIALKSTRYCPILISLQIFPAGPGSQPGRNFHSVTLRAKKLAMRLRHRLLQIRFVRESLNSLCRHKRFSLWEVDLLIQNRFCSVLPSFGMSVLEDIPHTRLVHHRWESRLLALLSREVHHSCWRL